MTIISSLPQTHVRTHSQLYQSFVVELRLRQVGGFSRIVMEVKLTECNQNTCGSALILIARLESVY